MNLQHPFIMLISSKRNSGKSVLLLNMLVKEELLYQKFTKIFFFSPTFKYQTTFDALDLPEEQIFEEFDEAKVAEIVADNKEEKEDVLIIFDDCISSKGFKSNKDYCPINELGNIGRHFNISLIIVSQKLTAVSTSIRNNTDYFICFKLNPIEQDLCFKSFCNEISKFKDFQELLQYCTKDRYNFLLIDNLNGDFYHNFNRIEIKKSV